MKTKELQEGFPEVQAAIYRVTLSLDALLLNGIPCGVLQRDVFHGFVARTAENLLRELGSWEEEASHAAASSRAEVTEVVAALRARCQQLAELVTGLSSFRALPREQVLATVSQIPLLR